MSLENVEGLSKTPSLIAEVMTYMGRDLPDVVDEDSMQFEKRRLLVLNTPLRGAPIVERVYYAMKRALIQVMPANYYYNRMKSARGN